MYEYCAKRQYFVQSIIYIYIYCQDLSQNFSKMTGNAAAHRKTRRIDGKRWETHDFTPFSYRFPSFSLDSEVKRRDFERFYRATEENGAFHRQFHAVYRRFLRFRSCSPCFVSGRENSRKRRGSAFSSAKIPKPSPGVPPPTGERRQGKEIPPPSGRSRAGFPTKKFCEGVPFLLLRSPCVMSVWLSKKCCKIALKPSLFRWFYWKIFLWYNIYRRWERGKNLLKPFYKLR